MAWNLDEAIAYYQKQGAPKDQNAVISLLKEIQLESGGSVPQYAIAAAARTYGVKESLFHAMIKRIPGLRLADRHLLELCAGPNCGKHAHLAVLAEKLCRASGGKTELKFTPCMRMCAKGPNLRWDGTLYNGADEALLRSLLEQSGSAKAK